MSFIDELKERAAKGPPPLDVPRIELIKHFTSAMVRWTGSGFKVLKEPDYIMRREICNTCTERKRCPQCGCVIVLKAALLTEDCPRGYWPKTPEWKYALHLTGGGESADNSNDTT